MKKIFILIGLLFIVSCRFSNIPACSVANIAYILSPSKSQVYYFDLSVNRVTETQDTGLKPMDMTIGKEGNIIYIANYVESNISVLGKIDANTYIQPKKIETGSGPTSLLINPNTDIDELYAACSGDSQIYVFTTYKKAYPVFKYRIAVTDKEKKTSPKRIVSNTNGDKLFVTDNSKLYILTKKDTESNFEVTEVLELAEVNEAIELQGSIVDVNDNVYIANSAKDEIIVFDSKSGKITAKIPISDASKKMYPLNMAISLDTKKLYVTDKDANAVSVVDIDTKKLIKTIYLATGKSNDAFGPVGIAIKPDESESIAYITNSAGRNLSIINTASDELDRNIGTHAAIVDLMPLGDIMIPREECLK